MKILIILSLIVLTPSCEFVQEEIKVESLYNYEFKNDIEIETMEEALHYVTYEIIYKADSPDHDYWQTPEETIVLKTGDCEDKSILLMYLLQKKLNLSPVLLLVENIITKDGHALVASDGLLLESTDNKILKNINLDYKILHVIPYSEVIWMTLFHHKNVGKYY